MSEHEAGHGHGHHHHHHHGVMDNPATARRFAATSGRSMKFRAFLRTVREVGVGKRVLDVGAGPGVVAATVAQDHPEAEVVALEPSTAMIEASGEVLARHGVEGRVRFVQGTAEDAGLVASLGPFDLIYSTYVLHHFADAPKAMAVMRGALADGGVLLVHDFRRVGWLTRLPMRGGILRPIRAARTPDELRALVAESGARDFAVRTWFPFLMTAIVRG